MKKMLIMLCIMLCGFLLIGCKHDNESYLRVHIRANSNSESDQSVKYLVKDVVVEYLTPKLSTCESKEDVVLVITENMKNIEHIILKVLQQEGFGYGCSMEINKEYFPTRTYDDLTLNADYYDAFIVKLGSGQGDNWWCVMYPNLCFNEIENVVYKSKIKEIIEKARS